MLFSQFFHGKIQISYWNMNKTKILIFLPEEFAEKSIKVHILLEFV